MLKRLAATTFGLLLITGHASAQIVSTGTSLPASCTNLQTVVWNGGTARWECGSAGALAPASPINSLQFNSAGSFGGSATLTYASSVLALTPVLQTDGSPSLNFVPTFPAEPGSYTDYEPVVFEFTRTSSGVTHADFYPGAYRFLGTVSGGDYNTDGDGLSVFNINSTVGGDAQVAYGYGLNINAIYQNTSFTDAASSVVLANRFSDTASASTSYVVDVLTNLQGSSTATTIYGIRSRTLAASISVAGDRVTTAANFYTESISATGIGTEYGVWVKNLGQAALANYGFYVSALNAGGASVNPYPFWSDEQGVFRIKADNTFNSVVQAIPALYNPQFTKYTPGAANYERIVQQWESNVAVITTEASGTGTLRDLRLGDAGVRVIVGSAPVAVASLPTCNSAGKGARATVTDANATTFLSTVAGSGANNVPVFCDGTNWKIG
jgi:hypothetical protein